MSPSVSQRLYFVPHSWTRLALGATAATLLCVVGIALPLPSGLALLVKLALVLATVGVVVWLRLIDASELRAALRRLRTSLTECG